ncbi:MAG: DUF2092 domain-containing protein [Anaerolineae bacterium]|nr:DUF2092 domain-containing protein [Phycisphaerae bacterium]
MHRHQEIHRSQRAALLAKICVVIIACCVPVAIGQDKKVAATGVEQKADAVLRQMSATLASAPAFTVDAEQSIDQADESGQKIQLSKRVHIVLSRPNKLATTVKGDVENLAYFYDGKTVTIVNNNDRVHAVQDAPDTIDAMFDFLAERFGVTAPLSDLLFSDPYKAMTTHVRSGRYLGIHEVAGVKCHHLAYRQDGIDWQIWVEDGERAVPRKVVITFKEQPGYPQFVAVLNNWDLKTTPASGAFTAKIPEGSKRVDLQPLQTQSDTGAGSGK